MSSGTENEPVLRVGRVLVDSSRHPSIRDELFGVGVDGRVVKGLRKSDISKISASRSLLLAHVPERRAVDRR